MLNNIFIGGVFLSLILFYLFFDIIVNDRVFLSPDSISATNEQEPLRKYHKETGQLPFWNPYSFAGMPSYESLTYNPYSNVIGNSIIGLIGIVMIISLTWSMYKGEYNLIYVISLSLYAILHLGSYVYDMETLLIFIIGGILGFTVGWFVCELEEKYD